MRRAPGNWSRKVQDVANGRTPKRVNRLRVVADDHQIAIFAAQRLQNLRLERVRVLVLVDQDVLELAGHLLRGWRRAQRAPEQEQVVVVEHVLGALAAGVLGEDGADAVGVVGAPGKAAFQDRAEALAGVDHARIDGHQGVFAREAALFALIAPGLLLAADQVHQVGHVGLVEHGEVGREAERSTVLAQEAIGDGVERPAPDLSRRV